MSKAPAFQFYVKDYLSDPQLKMASHSTKGIWVDMLCFMWDAPMRGELTGTVPQLQRMVGAVETDMTLFLHEVETLRFCDISVTDNDTVTLRNRRMWREEKDRQDNRERQQRHRDKRKDNGKVTPPSPTASATPKDLSPKGDLFSEEKTNGHCPHLQIIKLYRKHLPMCPDIDVDTWTKTRARHLQARWKENKDRQNLEWWEEFFIEVAKSKFLTGRVTPRDKDRLPFMAGLDWIVQPEHFARILEGFYHREGG